MKILTPENSTMAPPHSPACERNKQPINEILKNYFKQLTSILEIGSGTAQHATYFAEQHPLLIWQPSDMEGYIPGIKLQLEKAGLDNISQPLEIDVNSEKWLNSSLEFPAVYTANTFHIMSKNSVINFFNGLQNVLEENGYLFVYGPFNYQGKFTSESNAQFDIALKAKQATMGIRDIEWIQELATMIGLILKEDYAMPANNRMLVFKYE